MKNISKRLNKFALVIALFGLILPSLAFSQEVERRQLQVEPAGDIVLEPGKTEVFLDPGESVVKMVTITSRVPGNTSFSLSVEDMVGSEDPDQTVVLLGEAEGPYSVKDFLSPALENFTLSLGESISIPVTVSVPLEAEPGGHYGAVLISNAPSVEEKITREGATTQVVSRLGSLFLVRVNGPVVEEGQLEDFRLAGDNSAFHPAEEYQFEVLFRNSGSVHLAPYGIISISNMFGKEIDSVPVDAFFALPESLRARSLVWSPGFLLGRYTAELELNRGYDNLTDKREISFWVLPLGTVLPIILVIILLFAFLKWIGGKFELRRKK